MSGKTKALIIGGSVLVGLIFVSSIAAAVGGSGDNQVAQVSPAPVVEEPVASTPEPEVSPAATPTPTPVTVDPAYFRESAERDLTDFGKDLDDMDVTLDEGGFWRLLSNSVELSFNLGQLQALEVPSSVADQWTPGLATLEGQITAIDDAVGASDDAATRAAISAARAQVAALKAIAITAI